MNLAICVIFLARIQRRARTQTNKHLLKLAVQKFEDAFRNSIHKTLAIYSDFNVFVALLEISMLNFLDNHLLAMIAI